MKPQSSTVWKAFIKHISKEAFAVLQYMAQQIKQNPEKRIDLISQLPKLFIAGEYSLFEQLTLNHTAADFLLLEGYSPETDLFLESCHVKILQDVLRQVEDETQLKVPHQLLLDSLEIIKN